MGRSYATQDTFSKMIGDDSDSDSPPVGIYEVEERSQEMYSGWSTGSLRCSSPGDRGQSPAEQRSFSRHNISYVRGGTPGADSDLDDLSSLFHRTTTNLFGRDFEEAGADLARLLRPSRRSPRNVTPSLTSDDTGTSRTSSSSFSPHMTVHRELVQVPPPSPPAQSKVIEQVIVEVSEDAVAWAEPRVIPTEESYPSTQVIQETSSLSIRVEEPQNIVMPPPPRAEPAKVHDWNLSPFFSSVNQQAPLRTVSIALPAQLLAPVPVHEDSGRDKLLGDEGDDDYVPESSKPSRTPKRRDRKSGISGFQCPRCGIGFTRNYDMLRHIKSIHEAQTYDKILSRTCPCCLEVLSRKDAFKRHVLRVPEACTRYAKLQGRTFKPNDDPELFALCRSGDPPLARFPLGTTG